MMPRCRPLRIVLALALVAGCASPPPPPSGAWVDRREGVVASVHPVGGGDPATLADNRLGAFVGAVAGTAVGATIGEGAGRTAAVLLGFLFGQLGGAALENAIRDGGQAEVFVEVEGQAGLLALRMPAARAPEPGARVAVDSFSDGAVRLAPG